MAKNKAKTKEIDSALNEYKVMWDIGVGCETLVRASSKIDAINKSFNREGKQTISTRNPSNLNCYLVNDNEYNNESDAESEESLKYEYYMVSWMQDISYKTTAKALTRIHAINDAMEQDVNGFFWSRPYAIACDKVGNEKNDDGFQDD